MRGYDTKLLKLSHDSASPVDFTVQVDVLGNNTWRDYQTFSVQPGASFIHTFPDGYSAYWVRVTSNAATTASAQFTYGIAPGSAFTDWLETEGASSAGSDDDGDGLSALIEYAFGRPATLPDLQGDVHSLSPDGRRLTLVVRDNDPDLEVTIETSTTLDADSWQALPGGNELLVVDQADVPAGMRRRAFALPLDADCNFARARVRNPTR